MDKNELLAEIRKRHQIFNDYFADNNVDDQNVIRAGKKLADAFEELDRLLSKTGSIPMV